MVASPKVAGSWSSSSEGLSRVVLFLCAFLLQSDQSLLAPHLSAVAAEVGVSDRKRDKKLGGELALGLYLVGAPAAIGIGALGDVVKRRWLLVGILWVGAIASTGTGLARSFAALFWWRALSGVALGGSLPLTFSLLGDFYPPERRTVASGRIGLAMAAGQGLGTVFSGLFREWRVPFLVVGLGSAVLGVLACAAFDEPPRGRYDAKKGSAALACDQNAIVAVRALAKTPTVRLVFFQGIPGCVPWGVVSRFLVDYLHVDLGIPMRPAALVMFAFTTGVFVGMIVASEVGQRLYNWRRWAAAVYMGLAEVASAVPLAVLVLATRAPLALRVALAAAGGVCASQTGVLVRACLQNVVQPTHRSFAFAIFALFDDLGKASPILVAILVDFLGRRRAFALAIVACWTFGGAINALVALTLEKDERQLALTSFYSSCGEDGGGREEEEEVEEEGGPKPVPSSSYAPPSTSLRGGEVELAPRAVTTTSTNPLLADLSGHDGGEEADLRP
ncbi:hypothetical protein CTAYLR_010751 [Chrysophaeum taylorii]|uniref:Major facilitator superfamily (MFS) profile domain-containing protein n=1 Tax=Chrysophaeum taylorii TaxID=2483200 RepID=A0AAD7XLG6_9STRA|nr:hypothetical protein CTAYLR_010751 [Chrysophaeum taylorii]